MVFTALLLSFLCGYAGSTLLWLTVRFHPRTLDLALYSFDGSLGGQPSFATGQILLRFRWLAEVARITYYALPLPLMLVFALQARRQGIQAWRVLIAITVAIPLGFIFYNLLPACGPIYLVGSMFPRTPPSVDVAANLVTGRILPGARNAFPSLHFAWALLAWWYARRLPAWLRSCFLVFVALTALATLGLGEHYLIDLVAAFPFAVLVEALFAAHLRIAERRRLAALAGSLAMIAGWIVLLRYGQGAMGASSRFRGCFWRAPC